MKFRLKILYNSVTDLYAATSDIIFVMSMSPKAFDISHNIGAVIFDFDCTLADTLEMMVEAKMHAFTSFGFETPDPEYLASLSVLSVRDSISMVPGVRNNAMIDEITNLYHHYVMEESRKGCALFPGVIDTLKKLQSKGIKIGIVTSRPHDHITHVIQTMKLDNIVDAWVGEDKINDENPITAVDYLLDIFDIPAENAIVVGDTLYDLEMGREAGARTAACVLGVQSEFILRGFNPDMVFDRYESFCELAKISV